MNSGGIATANHRDHKDFLSTQRKVKVVQVQSELSQRRFKYHFQFELGASGNAVDKKMKIATDIW